MKILHIDSGISGAASVSRQLSAAIVRALAVSVPNAEVLHRDLDADPIPHLASGAVAAVRSPVGEPGDADAAGDRAILRQFLDADVVVLGAPMYNFGIPSQLKAWFDRILVPGKTFRYTASGVEGLAGGKTVLIASARGGAYLAGSPMAAFDFQEPHLRALFGFIGIGEITVIRAEGLALGEETRRAAIATALAAARRAGDVFAPAAAA